MRGLASIPALTNNPPQRINDNGTNRHIARFTGLVGVEQSATHRVSITIHWCHAYSLPAAIYKLNRTIQPCRKLSGKTAFSRAFHSKIRLSLHLRHRPNIVRRNQGITLTLRIRASSPIQTQVAPRRNNHENAGTLPTARPRAVALNYASSCRGPPAC